MRANLIFCFFLTLTISVAAQDAPPQGGSEGGRRAEFRNLDRVAGTIVSVSGDTVVVKPESGDNVSVKITTDTRIRKDRTEAKLADFKAGDHVFAGGKFNSDKSLTAVVLGDGQMRGPGGEAGGRMGMMGQPPSPEELQKMGLGTKFIVGEVKAIDETRLTILRPDGQTQTIEVDENTSFKAGRDQSITLADIKVGDRVMGRGEMKSNVFVPQTLRVGGGMMMMQHGQENGEHPAPPTQEPK